MIASAILRMVRDANELVKADALDEGLTVEAQKLQVRGLCGEATREP